MCEDGLGEDKEQSTIDKMVDLVDQLHDIHHYGRQHLKVSSDRTVVRYDCLANSAGLQNADKVCNIVPSDQARGKSPKL